MERIVKLIEDELDRMEEMIALRNWEIEELKEKLKKAEEELAHYRVRRPFSEAVKTDGEF
jgi:ribosomal protein L29